VADIVEFVVTGRSQDVVNLRRNVIGAHLVPTTKPKQSRV
jgi:hypothetical protein